MQNFKASLRYMNQALDLSFNKIEAPHHKYFVELSSKAIPLTFFEMEERYDRWHITEPAEDWIKELKDQLIKIISLHGN